MYVKELWRYPVKSLRGEALGAIEVRRDGFEGDRLLQVRDAAGRLITARQRPRLLSIDARVGRDGAPLVAGLEWRSAGAADALRAAAGDDARLVPAGDGRFDDTPLLLATDGAIDAIGVDGRRFRPNIVLGGVSGLEERGWPGRMLLAGEVQIAVEKLCKRCVITTFDPTTLAQDPGVLRRIGELYGGRFALNCHVARAGRLAVGDTVELN